jgi:hypothetical protein
MEAWEGILIAIAVIVVVCGFVYWFKKPREYNIGVYTPETDYSSAAHHDEHRTVQAQQQSWQSQEASNRQKLERRTTSNRSLQLQQDEWERKQVQENDRLEAEQRQRLWQAEQDLVSERWQAEQDRLSERRLLEADRDREARENQTRREQEAIEAYQENMRENYNDFIHYPVTHDPNSGG